jgi:LEA14-like dessication related protein
MSRRHLFPPARVLAVVAAAALAGCASLDPAKMIRKPTAEVVGVEIESVTFEQASLRLDVKVVNPNGIGIELAGFDYRLLVENAEVVRGKVDRRVSFPAGGSSVVPVPVTVRYENLIATVRALADKDESPYQVTVGLSFALPVLGTVRIPVENKGTLPVTRVPAVRVTSLRLDRMTLQGASLVLGLEISNPNGFGLGLASLEYRFAVSGRDWASGTSRRTSNIGARGSGQVDIPIDLDFGAVGRSVADVLAGRNPLAYALSARLGLSTTLPLLKNATVPIELNGQIGLTR